MLCFFLLLKNYTEKEIKVSLKQCLYMKITSHFKFPNLFGKLICLFHRNQHFSTLKSEVIRFRT